MRRNLGKAGLWVHAECMRFLHDVMQADPSMSSINEGNAPDYLCPLDEIPVIIFNKFINGKLYEVNRNLVLYIKINSVTLTYMIYISDVKYI